MRRVLLTAAVLLLLSSVQASAGSFIPSAPFSGDAAGTTGAAFLKLPTGGRELSMGGAAAAGTDGAEAMFWNPAGMGRMEAQARPELAVGYSALLADTFAGSLAFARPLGEKFVVGGGLDYFSQSPQTAYSTIGDPGGQFTPNDLAVNAAGAARFSPFLAGASVKLIRSSISDASGMAAALDAGMQVPHVTDLGDGAVDVGAAVNNLGTSIRVGGTSAPLPLSVRGGAMWHASPMLNAALDVVLPVDESPYVSFGLEGVLRQQGWKGFLRFGYNQSSGRGVDGLAGIAAGAGADFARFRFDYAWVPFGDLGTTNRIALAYRF